MQRICLLATLTYNKSTAISGPSFSHEVVSLM